MKRTDCGAFSLIEIIMVIVIIGILAAVIVPKFASFREEAQEAAEDATIGAIQSGINIATAVEEARK